MEALAAAGLASNVIQFIDFTAVLFRIYQDLRYKAASSENDDFRVIAEHLKPIAERISDSLQAISTSQSSSTASPQEQAIRSVADRCCELTKTLLNCLAACELKPGQNASRIQRTKILFRTMRSKSEIRDYVQRLETLREELILHTVLDSQQQVAEIRSSHSTKSDITRVLGKVEDLNDPLRRLDRESKTQYTVITNSIDILRRDNAQLHAETASKSTSNMQAALSKLDSIQQSIDALQLHQRNVPEPTAQKDVGDSCFEPGVPRRNTPYTAPPSLLHVGLQQHLSDYMKTMIREINEEIQGTMRGELGKAQTDMNRVLNEITEAMPEVPRSRHGSTGSSDLIYQCPNSPYELHPNAVEQKRNIPHRSPKENTTLLYRYKKEGSTGVGVFSLITCKKVVFRLTQPPLELYDLEVRFTPNSQLLSTGLSLTYHTTTIARQTPEFGFQPQTYRVLDDSHEVWSIISRGDTRRMQDLLSQSVISTSDRHVNGNTLLMYAVRCGKLDICKSLISSGADVNAKGLFGITPIVLAISHAPRYGTARICEIAHYLQISTNAQMDGLWHDTYISYAIVGSLLVRAAKQSSVFGTRDSHEAWLAFCLSGDIDLDVPGSRTFLESFVKFVQFGLRSSGMAWARASNKSDLTGVEFYNNLSERFVTLFDAIIHRRGGFETFPINTTIPVAYTAYSILHLLDDADVKENVYQGTPPSFSAPFHSLHIHCQSVVRLKVLEHVISEGIKQRPDSIFDTTVQNRINGIYGVFSQSKWKFVWEDVLRNHGIDPSWAWDEELKRRRGVIPGETSAHEVSVRTSASELTHTKRRKGFSNSEET